jgi:hypothetical protein
MLDQVLVYLGYFSFISNVVLLFQFIICGKETAFVYLFQLAEFLHGTKHHNRQCLSATAGQMHIVRCGAGLNQSKQHIKAISMPMLSQCCH